MFFHLLFSYLWIDKPTFRLPAAHDCNMIHLQYQQKEFHWHLRRLPIMLLAGLILPALLVATAASAPEYKALLPIVGAAAPLKTPLIGLPHGFD